MSVQEFDKAVLQSLARKCYAFTATDDKTITAIDPAGAAANLSAANLKAGAFEVGKDYYIFATVDNGASSYAISSETLFDAAHLVGGFHYGINRRTNEAFQPVNTAFVERGEGWESNVYEGVVPSSVWTLARRPRCNPAGMVCLPSGVWVDIYQASDDGSGGIASAFGKMPLVMKSWFQFNELVLAKGKRLLTYDEWCGMAMGSPQGLKDSNDNAWTAYANNGPQETGHVRNAVSSFGCRDAVGNVYEWLQNLVSDPDGANKWSWYNKMPGYGQLFMPGETGLLALLAGGDWHYGVLAGARAVNCHHYPWYVDTNVGARGACDSL